MKNASRGILTVACVLSLAAGASAQDTFGGTGGDNSGGMVGGQTAMEAAPPTSSFPVSIAQRPLTLPEHVLAIGDGGPWAIGPVFNVAHIENCYTDPLSGAETCAGDTGVGLVLGASYGVLSDLQVDASILPLQLSPKGDYGSPRIGATYRFVRGQVEVGARAGFTLAHVGDARKVAIDIGVPLDLHLGDSARISTGAFLNLGFYGTTVVSLQIPVMLTFNATPNIAVGLETGLNVLDFDHAGDTINIPLGIFAGYSLADDQGRAMLDVGPYFRFPFFILTAGSDTVHTNLWEVGLFARFHLFT